MLSEEQRERSTLIFRPQVSDREAAAAMGTSADDSSPQQKTVAEAAAATAPRKTEPMIAGKKLPEGISEQLLNKVRQQSVPFFVCFAYFSSFMCPSLRCTDFNPRSFVS